MRNIPTDQEVDVFGAQLIEEGEQGLLAPGDGEWSLAMFVCKWDDWVLELERHGLWLMVEWEAACDLRDDLEIAMEEFGQSADFMKLVLFVDRIDQRFRAVTVAAGSVVGKGGSGWWWHRIPRRTDQRLFLFNRWRPTR